MLSRHHRAVGDYLQERLYRPESLLANGSGQKFIARGYHTTGADLCTTSLKKHELNLSKARFASAISMSLFVPLLEFNLVRAITSPILSGRSIDRVDAVGIPQTASRKELTIMFRQLLKIAVAFCGSLMQEPGAVAKDGEAVTGWWSRVINGSNELMREVVEFRPDGTYTTGICMLEMPDGWCAYPAVPEIQGNYSLRGDTLALQNGLMPQESMANFSGPDASRADLKKGRPEVYRWRLKVTPDDPPTGRPPDLTLYLMDENNQIRQLDGMGKQLPGWQNR